MSGGEFKLTPHSIIASIIIASVLVALRLISADAEIYLKDIKSSTISFTSGASEQPLFNETAAAEKITLTGFSITLGNTIHTDSSIVLQRADQLHIKDLFVSGNTPVVVTSDKGLLSIVLGDRSSTKCCEGRIGVGEHVNIATSIAPQRQIDTANPNLLISCDSPPCSLTINLRDKSIENLILNQLLSRVSFRRAGTDISQPDFRPDSAIISGKLKITGVDLLNSSFLLRDVNLANGDMIEVDHKGIASTSVDVRDGALVLNGNLKNVTTLLFRPRGGDARDVIPNTLEVMIREPWHKTLIGIIASLTPILLQLILNLKAGEKKRRKSS